MTTFFIRSPSALIWSGTETLMCVCVCALTSVACVCVCAFECKWLCIIIYVIYRSLFILLMLSDSNNMTHFPSSPLFTHTLSLSLVWCWVWPHIFSLINIFMINECVSVHVLMSEVCMCAQMWLCVWSIIYRSHSILVIFVHLFTNTVFPHKLILCFVCLWMCIIDYSEKEK